MTPCGLQVVTLQVSSARRGVSWARGRGQAGMSSAREGKGVFWGQGQGAGRGVSWARGRGQQGDMSWLRTRDKQASRQAGRT